MTSAVPSPALWLTQVEVTNPNTSKTYFFPCNDWLRKVGDDESGLRKELVAGDPNQKGPTNYKVQAWYTLSASYTNSMCNCFPWCWATCSQGY